MSFHFTRGYISFFLDCGRQDLRHVQEFTDQMEAAAWKAAERFDKRVKSKADDMDDDFHRHQYLDAMGDEYRALDESFPQHIRQSGWRQACSTFESRLTEACKSLQDEGYAKDEKWSEIQRGPVGRIGRFLRSNADIHLENHEHWEELFDVFLVRNCIAHAGGDISLVKEDDKEDLEAYIEQSESLSAEDTDLVLHRDSIDPLVEILSVVIRDTASQISDWIEEQEDGCTKARSS